MNRLKPERLEELLERARGLRVTVVGDLMLDVYLSGSVSRVSPEAPVPVVHVTDERVALGGAANVAANVVALGARCDLIGCVGTDSAGTEIRRTLAEQSDDRIRAFLLERSDRPTTTKTRVVARTQQVVRFDREHNDDLAQGFAEEIAGFVAQSLRSADALILEDYNKGVLVPHVIQAALSQAAEHRIPSVVDPKFRHFFTYQGATVFKPNTHELETVLGASPGGADDAWLEESRVRLGCEHLLVTLGEDGMLLRSPGRPTLRVPAVAREVYDVSGAGDTVTACLAVGLAAGATAEEAAVLANFAAGIEVGKPGVATVSPDELRAALRRAEDET